MSTISVLLPNYNNGPYLKEALDSIFNQTHQDFVIYFVDDCSTDDSISVAESFGDDRLKVFKKEKNSGIVDTMNVALDKIDTKYFIRMDGDDISTANRFEKLIAFMESHPEIGVCTSDIQMFGEEHNLLEYEENPLLNKANLIFGHSIGHASSIFRTEIFRKNNIRYRDRFWRMEDYYLFYELKDLTLTTRIEGDYYHYRRGEYNNNPKIDARKYVVYRDFAKMVLEDLGMPISEDSIDVYMELKNRKAPTQKPKKYLQYIEQIKEANKKTKIYPAPELNLVLNKRLKKISYRLIDTELCSFIELLPIFRKFKELTKYFFLKKLKK